MLLQHWWYKVANVLVVDDDPHLTSGLQSLLKFKKHASECAHLGFEALERLAFQQFDLIILDGKLPDMRGYEICKEVRTMGITVPILMLTGDGADKRLGLESGATEYMKKPFRLPELEATIDRLLPPPG